MKENSNKVPEAVIRRLPRYYRYLSELFINGIDRISSKELSIRMGITASQIRQDLNNFGGFGQQGYGYNVKELHQAIERIIGLNKQNNMIIIGAGNVGQAIANYTNFEAKGFKLKALFDTNPKLIGLMIRGIEILDIDKLTQEFVKQNSINVAVLCVPKNNAQTVANKAMECNVKALWNFAPVDIKVYDDVVIENVHLSDSLYTLCYKMNSSK
ncbi:MAG: redox-sensing transcriptional repressor Rex [Clostridia bacterium]|nr:redox-sensing transcriptional repressor Rex [Clostridia bacterium]